MRKPTSKITGCTMQEEVFCREYLKDGNGRRAGIAAGYTAKTAKDHSDKMLSRPHVQAYLSAIRRRSEEATMLDFEEKRHALATIVRETADKNTEIIAAIAEDNKMVGDYAAEKRYNFNVTADVDLQTLHAEDARLIEQHKKDY